MQEQKFLLKYYHGVNGLPALFIHICRTDPHANNTICKQSYTVADWSTHESKEYAEDDLQHHSIFLEAITFTFIHKLFKISFYINVFCY